MSTLATHATVYRYLNQSEKRKMSVRSNKVILVNLNCHIIVYTFIIKTLLSSTSELKTHISHEVKTMSF